MLRLDATFGHTHWEIVIMKSGRARARFVPMDNMPARRVPGRGKGAWRVNAECDAPLPDEILDAFEGTLCRCCWTRTC